MNSRIKKIYTILEEEFEKNGLTMSEDVRDRWNNPFLVAVSALLSARTKDSLTISVMERFADRVQGPEDLEKLSLDELQDLIYPVGFYKTKALNLKRFSPFLREAFDNRIPDDLDGLMKLPGIGRKSANLILSVAFGKPAICVDTHVHRIMNRLDFVRTHTTLETEMRLRKKLDKELWITTNRIFVSFGQRVCTPVSPFCSLCKVVQLCRRRGVKKSR